MTSESAQQELSDTAVASEIATQRQSSVVVDRHSFSRRLSQRRLIERQRVVDDMLGQISTSVEDIPRTPTDSLLGDQ